MNAKLLVLLGALPVAALAQSPQRYDPPTAGESPPVQLAPERRTGQVTLASEQQLYAPAGTLVAPEQASAVIDKFKAAYERLGKPRLLVYVNRELVDDTSGLRLVKRTENVEASRSESKGAEAAAGKTAGESTTERVNAENTYESKNAPAPTLADRQTVRDLERLFGRPLRLGGAVLADQKVAATLIADRPMSQFMVAANDQARRDREALAKVADVVVEILISTRQLTVPEVSGNRTVTAPDITATAIRLSDAAIVGQASARDVLGKDRTAGRLVQQFDINDIAEATALALMEDVALGAK